MPGRARRSQTRLRDREHLRALPSERHFCRVRATCIRVSYLCSPVCRSNRCLALSKRGGRVAGYYRVDSNQKLPVSIHCHVDETRVVADYDQTTQDSEIEVGDLGVLNSDRCGCLTRLVRLA